MASGDQSEVRDDFVPLRGWQDVPLKGLLEVVESLQDAVPEIQKCALDSLE